MKDIGTTIAKHRKLKGLSQGKLAEELTKFNLTPSVASVSSWEKGVSIPNALQLLSICSVLGITDIYSEFIADDGSLLSGLNDEGKKRAMEYIALLRSSEEFSIRAAVLDTPAGSICDTAAGGIRPLPAGVKSSRKKIIENNTSNKRISEGETATRLIRLYELPASAGIGEFLDGDSFEEVEAGPDVPASASFGIRVSGDSMEPRFHDGQNVWVERKETLDSGEIGIFVLNGAAFIKKLLLTATHAELVSLNKAYKPIRIKEGDDLRCYGKVLN